MLSIRPATIADARLLTTMIRELAAFEHLSHETSVFEEDIARDGFGPAPKFRAVIAEWDGQAAGYALVFEFYSSFQGRTGLFLDDIFVRPNFREHGIGKALLAHVARVGVGLGIDGHRRNAHAARGGDDPARDLATIGDEDLLEHRPCGQSGMLACFFQGLRSFLLRSIASERQMRRLVLSGMITSSM